VAASPDAGGGGGGGVCPDGGRPPLFKNAKMSDETAEIRRRGPVGVVVLAVPLAAVAAELLSVANGLVLPSAACVGEPYVPIRIAS
jgi:hypothetical protein